MCRLGPVAAAIGPRICFTYQVEQADGSTMRLAGSWRAVR